MRAGLVPVLFGALRPINVVLAFVESNGGGVAVNAELTTAERAVRPAVKIFNPTAVALQSLDIDTNNLIGHTGLTDNATHGLENGLADLVERGQWPAFTGPLSGSAVLQKESQGGSTALQFQIGDASGYWSTFLTRWTALVALLKAQGYRPVANVFFTLGINDLAGATAAATYESRVQTILANIRSVVGPCKIGITQFMANHAGYSSNITTIIASHTDNFLLDGSVYPAGVNADHWDNNFFRGIANDAFNGWFPGLPITAAPVASPAAGTYGSTQSVTLTTATASASIYYTLNGEPPGKAWGTLYSGAISVDASKTLRAIAVAPGMRAATSSDAYLIGTQPTVVTWSSFTHASQVGDFLFNDGSISGGGGALGNSLDATLPFAVYIEYPANFPSGNAIVYLDDDNGNNYLFNGTNAYLCGIYNVSQGNSQGQIGRTTVGGGGTGGTLTHSPYIARMQKSGNDVQVHFSRDGGSTWTLDSTFTGALTSKTTIYIKALFAIASALKNLRVTFVQ